MEEIIRAQEQLTASKQRLQDVVSTARAQGHTWQEIGDALDMSRQAAFKRFGKPANPDDGNEMAPRPVGPILEIAERAFQLVASGDYDALHSLMTKKTAKALTAKRMSKTWASVLAEIGDLESCRGTRAELSDGTVLDSNESVLGVTIAATTVHCEAGEMVGRVAFDEDHKIIGMLMVPLDHGELPF